MLPGLWQMNGRDGLNSQWGLNSSRLPVSTVRRDRGLQHRGWRRLSVSTVRRDRRLQRRGWRRLPVSTVRRDRRLQR